MVKQALLTNTKEMQEELSTKNIRGLRGITEHPVQREEQCSAAPVYT